MNLRAHIFSLKTGLLSASQFKSNILDHQLRNLKLSKTFEFVQNFHTASVTSIDVDKDECRYILAGLGDGTVLIHDVSGGISKIKWRAGKRNLGHHSHGVCTVSWFSDNGIFLTSGKDGKLKVWDTNAGTVVEEFKMGAQIYHHCFANAEMGSLVAVASKERNVQIADLNTGSFCHILRGHSAEVYCSAWNPTNQRMLVTGSSDRKAMIWDIRQTRSSVAILDYNNVRFRRNRNLNLANQSHQGSVLGLEFSKCGNYLFSYGSDNRIRKWDAITLKNLKLKFPEINSKFNGHCSITIVPTGKTNILFIPDGNNVTALDCNTGENISTLIGHYSSVYSLAYSKEFSVLYSSGRDKFILQWDNPFLISAAMCNKVEEIDILRVNSLTQDDWSHDEDE